MAGQGAEDATGLKHPISAKFQKDNGGSVPPNLLAIANTESTSRYQEHCRDNNIPIHPARFPAQLPEYFIRMLTDEGDVVVDPFAGSCVTGAVAEALKREWACCEMSEEYLQGALARFNSAVPLFPRAKATTYEIVSPCALTISEKTTPLFKDGGAARPADMPKPLRKAKIKPVVVQPKRSSVYA